MNITLTIFRIGGFGFSHSGSGSKSHLPKWLLLILVLLPLIFALAYWLYLNRHKKKWEQGIFPENLRFKRDNLIEAYICLAGLMLRKDNRDYREKLKYVAIYFNKYFGEISSGTAESLTWSHNNPIDPKTVAFWINRHVQEESKRLQILYFLVGFSMVDGQMIEEEYAILREITPILKLTLKDLDAIISMYTFKEEEKRANAQGRTSNSADKKERVLKVFGLEANATLEELKMAYRKLVKIHHPDRFSNESKEQQDLAHERFIKIQEAYEYLESRMS